MNSQRVPPFSAREPRQSVPTADCRGKLHNDIACHGSVAAQPRDELFHNLSDQPGARILIETEVNGRVNLFEFISFRHAPASSQRETKDNVL